MPWRWLSEWGANLIDHIVVAVPDLAEERARILHEWGVATVDGGRHPAHGTHNALLRAGPQTYIEILAADPDVPATSRSARGRSVAAIVAPGVSEILIATPDPREVLGRLSPDQELLEDAPGERHRADGGIVRWHRLRIGLPSGGVLPDFIAWQTDHPARSLPAGVQIEAITILRPDAREAQVALDLLLGGSGLLRFAIGAPRVEVQIATPSGNFVIGGATG